MLPEDQAEVIEFLVAPSAHGNATVARIDTHSAIVFIAGARAYTPRLPQGRVIDRLRRGATL
jgi:hypothetical protein